MTQEKLFAYMKLVQQNNTKKGFEMDIEELLQRFKELVKTEVFPRYKFMSHEYLICTGDVSNYMRKKLGFRKNESNQFHLLWDEALKPICRTQINSKRSSAAQKIQQCLFGKFAVFFSIDSNKTLTITNIICLFFYTGAWLDPILDLYNQPINNPFAPDKVCLDTFINNLRNNKEDYLFFGEFVASIVCSKEKFNHEKCNSYFSDIVTVSDEALALLILDNSYNYWVDKYDNRGSGRETPKRFKYTNQQGARQHQGWNLAGIQQFGKFCEAVQADRAIRGKDFDAHFKRTMLSKYESKKRKHNQTIANFDTGAFRETFGDGSDSSEEDDN